MDEENSDSDSDLDESGDETVSHSGRSGILESLGKLSLSSKPSNSKSKTEESIVNNTSRMANSSNNPLSLLEYLLRLSALESFEQKSLLEIPDEVISLFLKDDVGSNIDWLDPIASTPHNSSKIDILESDMSRSFKNRSFSSRLMELPSSSPPEPQSASTSFASSNPRPKSHSHLRTERHIIDQSSSPLISANERRQQRQLRSQGS